MNLRGIFKNSPFFIQLSILIGFVVFGAIFSSVLFSILALAMGIPFDGNTANPDTLRIMQFWVSLFSFLVPAYLLALLFSTDTNEYLQLRTPSSPNLLLTIIIILASTPFLNLMVYLNEQVVFPEALKPLEEVLRNMEDSAAALTKQLLITDSTGTFLFNILLFGVVAGVGEELLFRGVFQRIFEKVTKNPHIVIWVVAFIFSAFHFQFYGLIPRMLIGALLGYMLLYTRSIWVPILAHFTNNTLSVVSYYFVSDTQQIEQFDEMGIHSMQWLPLLSLIVVISLVVLMKKMNRIPVGQRE